MAEKVSSLKRVLEHSLRGLGLQKRLRVEQLLQRWPHLVGPAVAKVTAPTQWRGGTLFIDVADSVWMQELKLQEGDLLRRLNETLDEPLVRRLFFQLARTSLPTVASPSEVGMAPPAARPLGPDEEEALEHEVAHVHDPELRAVLKDFRRRILQGRR